MFAESGTRHKVAQRTKGTEEHLCFGEKGSTNKIRVVKAAAADTRYQHLADLN